MAENPTTRTDLALEHPFPDLEDTIMTPDEEIDAEAKRWVTQAFADEAMRANRSGEEWWKVMSHDERTLARAHARYALERRAGPANLKSLSVVAGAATARWLNNDADRRCREDAVFQALLHRYGIPPTLREITDADVLRGAEAMWRQTNTSVAWERLNVATQGIWADRANACLEAFLSPPASTPPDPIDAALESARAGVIANGGQWTTRHAEFVRKALERVQEGRADG
jgi:hypothetical protein